MKWDKMVGTQSTGDNVLFEKRGQARQKTNELTRRRHSESSHQWTEESVPILAIHFISLSLSLDPLSFQVQGSLEVILL